MLKNTSVTSVYYFHDDLIPCKTKGGNYLTGSIPCRYKKGSSANIVSIDVYLNLRGRKC